MNNIQNGIIKNGLKIHKATVVSDDILDKGYSISGRKLKDKKYITIHNPSCSNCTAKTLHTALKNANRDGWRKNASWGISVDKDYIYQSVNLDWINYHATDGYYGTGNCYSLSIEVAEYTTTKYSLEKCKEYQEQAFLNAAHLTALLMKTYNIPIQNIVQHHKWYPEKDCPEYLRNEKYGLTWQWFIKKVKQAYAKLDAIEVDFVEVDTEQNDNTEYTVRIESEKLNVRKGPGIEYDVSMQVKKGDVYTIIEVQNNWGKLKSEAGWISLNSKYVERIAETFKSYIVRVITENLNIRKGPGTEYSIEDQLHKGDAYTIIEEKNKWGRLKSGQGWISLNSKYVEKI